MGVWSSPFESSVVGPSGTMRSRRRPGRMSSRVGCLRPVKRCSSVESSVLIPLVLQKKWCDMFGIT